MSAMPAPKLARATGAGEGGGRVTIDPWWKAAMGLQQILLCLLVAVSMAGGQVLFKLAAQAWNRAAANGDLISFVLSPPLVGALAVYGLSSVAWMFVLRSTPLSRAYAFALLGSAIVPVLAWAMFREPLTLRYGIGFALVLLGLYLCVGAPAATA